MSAENTPAPWMPVKRVKKLCEDFGTFTKVPSQSNQTGAIVNLQKPPMPTVREIVRYDHTTYVEFQRRNNSTRGQGLTKAAFIKNMLSLIQSVDKTAAILCYEDSQRANSICHPSHVPMEQGEFEIYFPRAYSYKGRITIKCRMTSSTALAQIKWKIRPKLEEYYYFLWPTPIKATRTAKAGWLYQAHPDLTYRDAIFPP